MSVQIIMDRDIYLDAPVTPVTLTNPIYAGDADAQRIRFRCFQKHGQIAPMDLSEITITAHFIRPDGGDVVITGTGGSTYSYVDLPEACYVYPGIFKLLVRASTSTPDVVTSILYVTGRIDKPTTDVIIDPGTTIPSLEDLLAQIDACEAAEAAANAAAASATAAAASGVRTDTDAQGLTDTQKLNARTNIGAADAADVSQLSEDLADANDNVYNILSGLVTGEMITGWIAGTISGHGAITNGTCPTVYSDRLTIPAESITKVVCDTTVEYKVVYYNSRTTQYNTWVKNSGDFTSDPMYLDSGYTVRLLARYKATPETDIEDVTPFSSLVTAGSYKVSDVKTAIDRFWDTVTYCRNMSGFIYTNASARHSWDKYGSQGGITFTVGALNLNFRLSTKTGVSVNIEDISSEISSYITVNESSVDIILPKYSHALVYNADDNLLHIRDYMVASNILDSDIVLVACQYAAPVKGLLYDEYINRAVEDEKAKNPLLAADVFNAEPYTGTYDWQTPVVSYGALFKGTENVEAFAFFTDPHIMGFADNIRNEARMQNYMKRVQKTYNSTPCGFIVSGGDWLNNSTTMDEACYRLGLIKGFSDHLLDGCKLVIGNHDTNYQGKLDANSANNTGRLADETIAAIMFRDTDTKKAYYSFDGMNSKCYVLDTGVEHSTMLAYDWEQVSWLAGKLSADDAEHSIIFLHMITTQGEVQTNVSNFASLVQAYNAHTMVMLNSVQYNFTSCTGHVEFWVAGHTHQDSNGTLGGIPYFITASNSYESDVPLIDLALADYDNKVLKLVRVGGTGTDRTISLT